MIKKRNTKKGAVGMMALFMAGFVLIIGFMFGVDLPMKLIQQNQLKDVTENAAKGAVTFLNETAVQEGHIVFEFDEAKQAVIEIVAESYDLELKPNYLATPARPFTEASMNKRRIKDMAVYVVEIQVPKGMEEANNQKEAFQIRDAVTAPEGVADVKAKLLSDPKYLHFDGIAVNIQATYMKTFDFSKFKIGKNPEKETDQDLALSRVSIAQARIQNYKK